MPANTPASIKNHLKSLANPDIARHSAGFFKTGKGEYGEGDQFLGIRVPIIRQQVKKYRGLSLDQCLDLVKDPYHEIRLFAVLALVDLFERGDREQKSAVYRAYLTHTRWINNWDLVDSSCHKIVGAYLFDKDRQPLYQLANSASLWEKRIAMISCYYLIKRDDFSDALRLAEQFLSETHDLMHKAVGWMLRELGKRDFQLEDRFLEKHYRQMPRTMLRYAIERFPKERKAELMKR